MITNLKDVVYHLSSLRKEHTIYTQGSIRAWQDAGRAGGLWKITSFVVLIVAFKTVCAGLELVFYNFSCFLGVGVASYCLVPDPGCAVIVMDKIFLQRRCLYMLSGLIGLYLQSMLLFFFSMLLIKLLSVSGNAYPGGIMFRCLSIKIHKIKQLIEHENQSKQKTNKKKIAKPKQSNINYPNSPHIHTEKEITI